MAEKEVVLGVDLGTTNSAVAALVGEGVEVLVNDVGRRTTPSCVHIQDSTWQVGEAALKLTVSDPARTIRNVKCILGMPKSAIAPKPLGPVPVKLSEMARGCLVIGPDGKLTPEEVAGTLLVELKGAAEAQLQRPVKKAVIAVPSYFNAARRRAVVDAAFLADLEVLQLVNETTAAALAYAHDHAEAKTTLVVDVGGGGGSVAVVKVEANSVNVLASSGVRLPGGNDFDNTMVEYLKKAAEAAHDAQVLADERSLEILRAQWVSAKHKLSRLPVAAISAFLPGLDADFQKDVKRADFEEQCEGFFKQIVFATRATLFKAKVAADQVDLVLLVGGSTRVPRLRALIEEAVGKQVCKALNPDEAVAMGAALLASGAATLEREALSLDTKVSGVEGVREFKAARELPADCDVTGFPGPFEVSQGIDCLSMLIYQGFQRSTKVEIDISGMIHFYDSCSNEIVLSLEGCLPPCQRVALQKGMMQKVEMQLEELARPQAKKDLEDMLRAMRAKEISPDDCAHEDAVKLREDCERQLDVLMKEGDTFAKDRLDKLRAEVEGWTRQLDSKRAAEGQRRQAREALGVFLQVQISRDELKTKVEQFVQQCRDELQWLSANSDARAEDYEGRLRNAKDSLETLIRDQERHAALQRKLQAREALQNAVKRIAEIDIQREDVIGRPYLDRIVHLAEGEHEWMLKNEDTATGDEYVARRQRICRKVSEEMAALQKEKQRAEEQRVTSFKALKVKVLEATQLQVPSRGDVLYDETVHLVTTFGEKQLAWLKKSHDAPKEELDRRRECVEREMASLQSRRAAEDKRLAALAQLTSLLLQAPQTDPANLELKRFSESCSGFLRENPAVDQDSIDAMLEAVRNVVTTCGSAREHREKAAAEAALGIKTAQQAADAMQSLLHSWGLSRPPSDVVARRAGASASRSVKLAEDHDAECMDTDDCVPAALCRGGSSRPAGCCAPTPTPGPAGVRDAVRAVWDQPLRPVALLPRHDAVLEALAEASALEALEAASAAGCMALILDKARAADGRELVALSVRYVLPAGDAVERPLLVRRQQQGLLSSSALVRDFLKLCRAAGIANWSAILACVSAADCGRFGHTFAESLNGLARRCIPPAHIPLVRSASVRLDRRLTLACLEGAVTTEPALRRDLAAFFDTVDDLRRLLGAGGQWAPLLPQQRGQGDADPWATYTSSVGLLRGCRSEVLTALSEAARCDPQVEQLSNSMNDLKFHVHLQLFDWVFVAIEDLSDLPLDSRFSADDFTAAVAQCKDLLHCPDKRRRLRNTLTNFRSRLSRVDMDKVIKVILDLALLVVGAYQEDFSGLIDLMKCIADTSGQSRGRLDLELQRYREEFPNARHPSLQDMLRQMGPEAFEKYPNLYVGLRRALSLPLLAPSGLRSADQLREGVSLAAGAATETPASSVEAAVVVAMDRSPLSESSLERVVTALAVKYPDVRAAVAEEKEDLMRK